MGEMKVNKKHGVHIHISSEHIFVHMHFTGWQTGVYRPLNCTFCHISCGQSMCFQEEVLYFTSSCLWNWIWGISGGILSIETEEMIFQNVYCSSKSDEVDKPVWLLILQKQCVLHWTIISQISNHAVLCLMKCQYAVILTHDFRVEQGASDYNIFLVRKLSFLWCCYINN